jgi:hypothetical protein
MKTQQYCRSGSVCCRPTLAAPPERSPPTYTAVSHIPAGRRRTSATTRQEPRRSIHRSANVEAKPLPDPASERVEAAIGVDAVGAEEKSAWAKRRARASPAARQRVAAARHWCCAPPAVERELHRALQCGGLERGAAVRDPREYRGADTEASEHRGRTEEAGDGRLDPPAGGLVGRPVERDAALVGVVTGRVSRKVAGAEEEEPQVSASQTLERAASAQLTAFFTSAPIFASSAAVNSFSAKEVGHMAPLSRFASSLKPNVAYLELNFCALWK